VQALHSVYVYLCKVCFRNEVGIEGAYPFIYIFGAGLSISEPAINQMDLTDTYGLQILFAGGYFFS
jgi:hypothetical protein